MSNDHNGALDIGTSVLTIALSLIIGNWVCKWLGWGTIDGTFLLTVATIILVGAVFALIVMMVILVMATLFMKAVGK